MTRLILPGSLEFFLASQEIPPPPGWKQLADQTNGEIGLISRGFGLLEAVPLSEYWDFVCGGEYDELDLLDDLEEE